MKTTEGAKKFPAPFPAVGGKLKFDGGDGVFLRSPYTIGTNTSVSRNPFVSRLSGLGTTNINTPESLSVVAILDPAEVVDKVYHPFFHRYIA